MTPAQRLVENIRTEFEKALSGSGVSWNKIGILMQLDRSITAALLKELQEQITK